VKELEERRAKKHSLDIVIDDKDENSKTGIGNRILVDGEVEPTDDYKTVVKKDTETIDNDETKNL